MNLYHFTGLAKVEAITRDGPLPTLGEAFLFRMPPGGKNFAGKHASSLSQQSEFGLNPYQARRRARPKVTPNET